MENSALRVYGKGFSLCGRKRTVTSYRTHTRRVLLRDWWRCSRNFCATHPLLAAALTAAQQDRSLTPDVTTFYHSSRGGVSNLVWSHARVPSLYTLASSILPKALLHPCRRPPAPLASSRKIDLGGTCDLRRTLITATIQTTHFSTDLPATRENPFHPIPLIPPRKTSSTKRQTLKTCVHPHPSWLHIYIAVAPGGDGRTTPAARHQCNTTPDSFCCLGVLLCTAQHDAHKKNDFSEVRPQSPTTWRQDTDGRGRVRGQVRDCSPIFSTPRPTRELHRSCWVKQEVGCQQITPPSTTNPNAFGPVRLQDNCYPYNPRRPGVNYTVATKHGDSETPPAAQFHWKFLGPKTHRNGGGRGRETTNHKAAWHGPLGQESRCLARSCQHPKTRHPIR